MSWILCLVTLNHHLQQRYFGKLNLNMALRDWESDERWGTPKTETTNENNAKGHQMMLDHRPF
jgi:hypothetical protein